jgi:hypothetical protein
MEPSKRTNTRNGTFGIPRKYAVGIVCLGGLVAISLVSNIYNVITDTLPVTVTNTSRGGDMDELHQLVKSEAQEDESEGSQDLRNSILQLKEEDESIAHQNVGFTQGVQVAKTHHTTNLSDGVLEAPEVGEGVHTVESIAHHVSSKGGEPKAVLQPPTFDYVSILRPKPPAFVFIFHYSGIGSQLLGFFAHAILLKETQNRTMVADTSTYSNRYNRTVGLLTGYFTPKFPVIDTAEQQEEFIQPFFSPHQNYTQWRRVGKDERWKGKIWKGKNNGPITVKQNKSNRKEIHNMKYNNTQLYNKLVDMMCPHLQFNPATERRIAELKRSFGVPRDWDPNLPSASFHIRRGDKLKKESKKYGGAVYIHKLKQIAPNVTFEHCFVATDDYNAIKEIRRAAANETISICRKIHSLTKRNEKGHKPNNDLNEKSDAQTIRFIAELQSMITTTYFVGTFNSNVGTLASVLRGCHGRNDDYPHFAHSYGVDRDGWYLR